MQMTFDFALASAGQSSTDYFMLANYTMMYFLNFCLSKYISWSNHQFGVTQNMSIPATAGKQTAALCSINSGQVQGFHRYCSFDLLGLVLFRSHKRRCNYLRYCCSHWRLRHNFSIHLDRSCHILLDSFVTHYYILSFGSRSASNYCCRNHCTTAVSSLVQVGQDQFRKH